MHEKCFRDTFVTHLLCPYVSQTIYQVLFFFICISISSSALRYLGFALHQPTTPHGANDGLEAEEAEEAEEPEEPEQVACTHVAEGLPSVGLVLVRDKGVPAHKHDVPRSVTQRRQKTDVPSVRPLATAS